MISRPKLDAENDANCPIDAVLKRFHQLFHEVALAGNESEAFRQSEKVSDVSWRMLEINGNPMVAIGVGHLGTHAGDVAHGMSEYSILRRSVHSLV